MSTKREPDRRPRERDAFRRDALADPIRYVLSDEDWDTFVRLLRRAARPMPRLAAFLIEPSAFEERPAERG